MRRRAAPWGGERRGLGAGRTRARFGAGAGARFAATPVRRRLAVTGLAMERKGERWSGLRHEGQRPPGRGPGQRREPRPTAAVRSSGVRRPSSEVAPTPTPSLRAAGPRPSARAFSGAGGHRPSFPARPSRALGPLLSPTLGGRGRVPPARSQIRPEPPRAHPARALRCAPWAASPRAGRLAKAAALAPQPPLRQALQPCLAPLLGLHPHLGRLFFSTFALHPSLSPAVLALQARKKRTKAKKDKAQRK